MDGQSKSQKVVLIHDASGGMRLNGVKWALDGFSLKDGDSFILLAVVSQVHHPSMVLYYHSTRYLIKAALII